MKRKLKKTKTKKYKISVRNWRITAKDLISRLRQLSLEIHTNPQFCDVRPVGLDADIWTLESNLNTIFGPEMTEAERTLREHLESMKDYPARGRAAALGIILNSKDFPE